jgi:Uma2 family endonuclease
MPTSAPKTIAELVDRLGDVPLDRILLQPIPGEATVEDVVAADAHQNRLCELVDGVLVEKPMGFRESLIAAQLIQRMRAFAEQRNLGVVSAPDGMLQLSDNMVRMPDVAFIAWNRFPGRKVPSDPAPQVAPDLAVEVLSPTNTRREMERKRTEYFAAGTRLVWQIDPDARRAEAYTSVTAYSSIGDDGHLEGGDVLPGFVVTLKQLFADLD